MVPVFTQFFYPILKFLSNGEIQDLKGTCAFVADYFNLSPEDRVERIKSGRATKVYDRSQWTMTYLRQSGLIESPKRGRYLITSKGLDMLATGKTELNQKDLCEISPEFEAFLHGKKAEQNNAEPNNFEPQNSEETPTESFDNLFVQINESLASELLEQIKSQTPSFFEQLVIDLLVKMGYGGNREDAASVTKMSHDGGIDGIIKEDRLGLDMIYIQAKRWEETVQKPEIHKFSGALKEKGANKGIFITTSKFSNGAIESARAANIVLIDGSELCRLMIEYGVGVYVKKVYEIKKIDNDYFNPDDE